MVQLYILLLTQYNKKLSLYLILLIIKHEITKVPQVVLMHNTWECNYVILF